MSAQYEPVKTAVVGCGKISDIFIRNLSQLFSIIDLTALCNRTASVAESKAKQFGIKKVMTLEEIAADPEIELVINLTPPEAHYDVIGQMLRAGKHVFTEKVMTPDLEQSRALVRLAEEKGLFLGVTPDTVLGAGVQTARHILDAGLIGQVTSCQVCINRDQTLNSEIFRMLRGNGGSLPYDVGIYYVGAMLALLGPVKAVRAFGAPSVVHEPELLYTGVGTDSWQIPGNNLISAALQFESGALASVLFDGNTVNAQQHAFTIFGTRGVLQVGDPNTFDGPVKLILPESGECVIPFTHGYDGKNTLEPAPFDFYGHRGVGAAELAWAIRTGRKNIRCSAGYGLHCQEVLYGMDEAARTGGTYEPQSQFVMEPLKPGYYSSIMGGMRGDAERSLM
ncbi:MAG: Gfo/Idh/MocA family oxidoreductase [Oscillibacter sp.]|nr:Gfo/Idh/MocA family oxidoreductase [Oscillibacter sp.]